MPRAAKFKSLSSNATMPSEFLFPLQADDLTECGGDRYAVEMPLDMSAMAPEELTDILEGMPRPHFTLSVGTGKNSC